MPLLYRLTTLMDVVEISTLNLEGFEGKRIISRRYATTAGFKHSWCPRIW